MVAGKKATPKDEKLVREGKKYWNTNASVGWGTPGDWGRCVDEVAAASGMPLNQAKGYCAERHHDATGTWPGQDHHKGKADKGK